MPPAKGHAKWGGRKRGSVNKVTSLARQKLAEAECSAENTVESIRRGQLFDPGDLFDDRGRAKPLSALTEAQRWMIKGIKVRRVNLETGDGETDEVVDYTFDSRAKYVEMAAKYHSLLTEKVDVSVTEVGNRLERARQVAMERNAKKGGEK